MCKKLMLLSCLVTVLGLNNIAFAQFEIFKVDFSCPAGQAGKKGGDWLDFVLIDGCDYDAHGAKDGQWGLIDAGGTDIDVYAGRPSGHTLLTVRDGDPISNSTLHFTDGGEVGCGDMTLGLRDLDPDTTYTVYTYHAWDDDDGDINSVNPATIVGADSNLIVNIPGMVDTTLDAILLAHPNVGVIQFTTDSGPNDVYITFNGCVRFNAFELWSETALSRTTSPNPGSNETDVCPKDLQLYWTPGGDVNDANGHDVYFGADFNDVTDANRTDPCGVLVSQGQDSNEYPEDGDPCLQLELMTTYYWRVDQVNDTNIWTGSIWSFTTEDGNARDPDPVAGSAGLLPDANVLSWTPSCVAASQDVYFSTDFDDVNTLHGDALYTTVGAADNNIIPTLAEFTTYYWRIETTRSSPYGTGASEVWKFSTGLGGLLLEMKFEGSLGADLPATELDTSGNELDFTTYSALHDPCCAYGSVKYGDGRKTGTSAVFDPCAGLYRQDTGDSDPLRLAGLQYTIQMWVYLPAGVYPDENASYMIVGKQNGWNIHIHDPCSNDDIRWYFGGMPDKGLIAEGILEDVTDDWVHVAAVFDMTAQETHKLYIDGLIEDSGSYESTNSPDNNTPVGIGVGVTNPPPFSFDQHFEGKIDELQIWDIALEQVPEFASEPNPPDGSRGWQPNDVNVATFTWRPGKYAADVDGHDIYFGDSLDDVNESADPCMPAYDTNSWTHGETFEIGRTYYWRVDEVNGLDVYPGYIWKFQIWADLIDPNIVVYYPLDETSGDDVPDYSGNYFDADCDNDPHWEPDNGRFGGCMHFSMEYDEDDDEWENEEPGNIEVESAYARQMADMIDKEISICVWVNGDPDQREDSDMVVFEFCDDEYENDIDGEPNDTKIVAVVPAETGDVVFRAGVYPQDTLTWDGFEPLAARGTWQHFVFIKNENDPCMYIYLNAELVATKEDCNTITLADVNSGDDAELEVKLGAYVDDGSGYHGRLDEFQIYNKALNEQEIEKIFRGGELAPAWGPSPYDGQGNVSFTTDLTWKPGAYVADTNGHEVYFGTNYDEVFGANTTVHSNVEYSRQDACSYDPCGLLLELGQTYYWRVDEANDACDPNGWRGRVWRFTTLGYITIDDFEDDTAQDPPSDDWEEIAGAAISLRSTPPVIGKKSMKYVYNNDLYVGYYYSEIESKSLEPNDWTMFDHKLKLLSLWFYGSPTNAATVTEQMYVYLKDNDDPCNEFQVKYGDADWEDMNDVKIADWQEWLIPLSHFSTNDVNLANLDNLCIGFGIRGWGTAAGYGTVYFDNIRLYPSLCAPWWTPEGDLNGDCVVDFEDVEIIADGWLDSDCNCIEEYGSMPSPPGEPNLVAWYEFEDGSGDTATDSTSNDNDGTIAVIDANVFWFTGYDGGGALDFDGGWVSGPNGPTELNLTTDAVTVSCWINRAESADDGMQVVCKGRNDWESYSLEVSDDEKLSFLIRDPNGDDKDIEGDKTLPLDEWLHIAGTCDGNNMTLYLNGRVEKTEEKGNFEFHADVNDGLGIAERWGDIDDDDDFDPFIGTIDDVRIYDYALSGGEICYIASDGGGVAEMVNLANISKDEPEGKQVVNLKDFAKLAKKWLKKELWPE